MARRHFLVNRPVIWMGKVSFSAYLLHFSVIPTLAGLFPRVFATGSTGFAAIFHFAALFGAAVGVTFLVSYVTYRLIELPLIAVGKHVCGRLAARSRPA